jgi:hypothetical protein
MDSFVNEIYDDIRSNRSISHIFSVNEELTSNDFTKYSTLSKYQAILKAAGQDTFAEGEPPFQEVAWLQKLRNYWVHYEREVITSTQSPTEYESSLESALRDRYDPNPLYEHTNERFLPRLGVSYGCCEWAVQSTIEFVEEFREKIGDDRRINQFSYARSILDIGADSS